MKKTLCYKAVARKTGEMVSDGFIVVEIENRKIISLEGLFTVDYLTSKIDDDIIEFEYYTLNETFDEYINTVEIPVRTEEFVLPCTVTLVLKDGNKFEIEIRKAWKNLKVVFFQRAVSNRSSFKIYKKHK